VKERFDGSGMERGVMLKEPLVVMNDRDQVAAEQYRILYTKVEQISLAKSFKAFAITSAVKGEGKSVTSLNLAYVMAKEFGKKVVLVECDFRNPSITSQLLDMGEYGLVDVIEERADLKDAIKRLEGSNLYLLPAGKKVKNAPEVMHSKRLSTIISTLKAEYDYVIIDSPPILPLVDMNILTKIVDGLLLVVKAGKTPKDMVIKAVNSVSQDDILGIILNGTEPSLNRYYY
jgi:capsular exopolysaccharide synthesis family protein